MSTRIPNGHPDRKHGGGGLCRPCYAAAWRARNPSYSSEHGKAWYAANTDKAKAYSANRRATRPEETRAVVLRWRVANPEKSLASAMRYYHANQDKVRARRLRYKARLANATCDVTAVDLARLRAGRCHYCKVTRASTVDHVVPLSRGGSHTKDNLVGACRKCNSHKNARTPEEWSGSC